MVQGTLQRDASMTYNKLTQVGGPGHQPASLPGRVQGQGPLRFAASGITACAGLLHCLFLLLDVLGTCVSWGHMQRPWCNVPNNSVLTQQV